MNKPKRHHYVPEMLQKRFADQNGQLHFFNKDMPEKGILIAPPGKLLVQRHLYSKVLNDGSKDTSLEEEYSILESEADQMFSDVIQDVLSCTYPAFAPDRKLILTLFIYEQWRRVPEMLEKVSPASQMRQTIADAITELERASGKNVSNKIRDAFLSNEYVSRFHQNARVSALWRKSETVLNTLMNKGVFFGVSPNACSFLIGSSPVLKLTPKTNDLNDPTVEVWLPIHPRVVVALGGYPFDGQIVRMTRKHVRQINLAIAKNSSTVAGQSRAEIDRIARHCSHSD